MSRKVLVIGLDGGDLSIIERMAGCGLMPNIASLMENGCFGGLKSTYPPITASAWASFMTGRNPGKHGVFDFVQKIFGSYKYKFTSSTSIKGDTLWDILERYNKTQIVLNVPLTSPIKGINGIMITNTLDPRRGICLEELHWELEDKFGEYLSDIFPYPYMLKGDIKGYLRDLRLMTEKQRDVALYCMEQVDWSFFMVVFLGPDRIQHALWDYLDSDTQYTKDGEYRNLVEDYYRYLDSCIGEILKRLDRDTNIFIISDHGFQSLYKKIDINAWLVKNEFLKFKSNLSLWGLIALLGRTFGGYKNIIQSLSKIIDIKKLDKNIKPALISSIINWSKTTAFSLCSGGIYINLKGREPAGAVGFPDEYEKIRDEIIEKLYNLREPESGEKVIHKVLKREQLYKGDAINNLPDLIITECARGYSPAWYSGYKYLREEIFMGPEWCKGGHRLMGLIIAYGPDIKNKKRIYDAEIIDICPTILTLFDIPLPKDIDGKVLRDILY